MSLYLQFTSLSTLSDPMIMNRRPGEQILPNKTDVTITCLRGWKEPDCQTCAQGWREPNCQTCAQRWAGDSCDKCARNFGPVKQCDSCLTGRVGPNCEACEGFGFNTDSNCTECIQNGYWTGTFSGFAPITVYLTFDGPACTNLVSGMY